jgi:prefoldin subunit 5
MNLDQTIVNWAFGAVGILGGVVLREMWEAIKALRKDNEALIDRIAQLNEKIGREYVRRDDYRDDIAEVKAMLARIFDKLDEKADKP